jgi:hypothetical protein
MVVGVIVVRNRHFSQPRRQVRVLIPSNTVRAKQRRRVERQHPCVSKQSETRSSLPFRRNFARRNSHSFPSHVPRNPSPPTAFPAQTRRNPAYSDRSSSSHLPESPVRYVHAHCSYVPGTYPRGSRARGLKCPAYPLLHVESGGRDPWLSSGRVVVRCRWGLERIVWIRAGREGVRRAWRWVRNYGGSCFVADNVEADEVWFRCGVIGRRLVSDYVPLNENLAQTSSSSMKKLPGPLGD